MSFTGGQLKLKGGAPLKPAGGVAKKKAAKAEGAAVVAASGSSADAAAASKELLEGKPIEQKPGEDRRTEAEKRHDERVRKMEAERVKKLAGKSHRERIKEFNDHLASLSEHHDIPKVGPG